MTKKTLRFSATLFIFQGGGIWFSSILASMTRITGFLRVKKSCFCRKKMPKNVRFLKKKLQKWRKIMQEEGVNILNWLHFSDNVSLNHVNLSQMSLHFTINSLGLRILGMLWKLEQYFVWFSRNMLFQFRNDLLFCGKTGLLGLKSSVFDKKKMQKHVRLLKLEFHE